LSSNLQNPQTVFYGNSGESTCHHLQGFVKEPSENHILVLCLNFLLYAVLVGVVIVVVKTNKVGWVVAFIIVEVYSIYTILGYCFNSLTAYFGNMKSYK
jgi:hypothetical protein